MRKKEIEEFFNLLIRNFNFLIINPIPYAEAVQFVIASEALDRFWSVLELLISALNSSYRVSSKVLQASLLELVGSAVRTVVGASRRASASRACSGAFISLLEGVRDACTGVGGGAGDSAGEGLSGSSGAGSGEGLEEDFMDGADEGGAALRGSRPGPSALRRHSGEASRGLRFNREQLQLYSALLYCYLAAMDFSDDAVSDWRATLASRAVSSEHYLDMALYLSQHSGCENILLVATMNDYWDKELGFLGYYKLLRVAYGLMLHPAR